MCILSLFIFLIVGLLLTIAYNGTSIYDVATEESNVPEGRGKTHSVYAVLGEVAVYSSLTVFNNFFIAVVWSFKSLAEGVASP